MNHNLPLIIPDWPAPSHVKAIQTTRLGGISVGVYASLNLGLHVKDNPIHVEQNRQKLASMLPSEPVWLNQVHGIHVVNADLANCLPEADASYSARSGTVCVTMTADCLPILLCDTEGTKVAAIHAGWRSLCDGVIEATVAAMAANCANLLAWLGPAIGPNAFEVGSEVRERFMQKDKQAELAFQAHGDKWLGNLYQLAQQRLTSLGISQIFGGGLCTYQDESQFFSFRRDGDTGRMGTFIWLES